MFSGATSKFVELFLSSQMSQHTRCTGELIFFGLLNALPLPPKRRFHQAAAATKLAAAAATLPSLRCRYLHRRHDAAAAPLLPHAAADPAFVSIIIVVAVIIAVSVVVAVAAFC